MDSLYSRYSSALLSLVKDENKVSEYKDAIKELVVIFKSEEKIAKYLESYFVSEDEKYSLIIELTKKYKLKHLSSFMKLLVHKHRFFIFDKIAKEFIEEANESLGVLEGFIYSVSPLSNDEIDKVNKVVSKKMNQTVELKNLIDERLIGGIKVVVHDHVFDGSIKGKLENLKNNLNERRNG